MGTFDGGPRPDFFTLSDAGHGRIPRGGRAIALDRLIAQGWIEVARYPNDTVAGEALDEAVGDGGAANEWRLRVVPSASRVRVLATVGLMILMVAAAALIRVFLLH